MSEERRPERRWRGPRGNVGGCGCASVFVVLTVGLLLSIFNAAIGLGVSVRVPFTQSNLTVAGAVGEKEKTLTAMPEYTQGRVGKNQNFINQSNTLTIWVAEGAVVLILGKQDSAPIIDLHLAAR